MLEFLGIIFLGVIIYMLYTSEELHIHIKVDDKDIVKYDRNSKDDKSNE